MLYVNPKYDLSDEVLDNLGAAMSGRKGKNQGVENKSGTNSNLPKSGGNDQRPSGGETRPPKK